jgi:glycosyltransferase involved in cell wall biosynthesis
MKKMVVIVPSYNNQDWCANNLFSILDQNYEDFRVIYIDDCSSDKTGELVQRFIADHGAGRSIHLIRNRVRVGALQNIYNAIESCADNEIVVLLDGDDWFAHDRVLKKIDEAYADPNCWMTYGQYRSWPDNKVGCSREATVEVIKNNTFRENEWCYSHLRSFYAWLFKLIRKEDLIGPSGTFYQMAWDQAIMLPMMEMSGDRARFISEILCIYNVANPISDCAVDRELQRRLETAIRMQKRYNRL